ncbi:MAG TPA: hypothetical protein VKB93_00965 [Thermoanaerobaculia bacterium]|nr:hypothetical protein [Thermoanaerobaculia bacterium]
MKPLAIIVALIGALLCAAPLLAQPKIDTVVDQINDRRTGGSFSQLSIMLKLPKIQTGEVAASRVLVSFAVDDLGISLIDSKAEEPQLEMNSRAMYAGADKTEPATVTVNLKNPSRKATIVKQVTGDIELYMPSKDPNSVAEFPKFASLSGKTLTHKALKANGVEIAAISTAQIAAEKKKIEEAKRKELKEQGYEDETIKSVLDSQMEYTLRFEEGETVLKVKDPQKRIHDVVFVDGAGEEKRVSMSDNEGYTVLSLWGEKPQPDWKLRISLKTAKNIVRYPFALSNLALP